MQWSEVAKCGTKNRRDSWRAKNINLSIHNLGSAQIYDLYSDDDTETKKRVMGLIKIHGDIGQFLRGEKNNLYDVEEWVSTELFISLRNNQSHGMINSLKNTIESEVKSNIRTALINLTSAVIAGVDETLWDTLKDDAIYAIDNIVNNELLSFSCEERIRRMKPNFSSEKLLQKVNSHIKEETFWYPEIAFESFSDDIFII